MNRKKIHKYTLTREILRPKACNIMHIYLYKPQHNNTIGIEKGLVRIYNAYHNNYIMVR